MIGGACVWQSCHVTRFWRWAVCSSSVSMTGLPSVCRWSIASSHTGLTTGTRTAIPLYQLTRLITTQCLPLVKRVFRCAENRDWKLIFISRGHVLRDWQWCKIDVKDRVFCLADETNGRRWRWRIYECSCCTCCVCYDRLSSEYVLVITSCIARARHKYS